MTSVERVCEYTKLPQESDSEKDNDLHIGGNGDITFDNVSLIYPGAINHSLSNLYFEIKSGEKVFLDFI